MTISALHNTRAVDYWYGKIYWQYILPYQKPSAWDVCRRKYGNFIFLVIFEILDDFDHTQIKPYPIMRVTDPSVIDPGVICNSSSLIFVTELSKSTLPRYFAPLRFPPLPAIGRFFSNSVGN